MDAGAWLRDAGGSHTPVRSGKGPHADKEKIKNLDKKKLKEASQGLEAEFLKVFLKQSKKLMFDNQNKENKAPGKDIMTDFMFERLAEHMAMSSPLGLSEMIVKDIEKKSSQTDESNN